MKRFICISFFFILFYNIMFAQDLKEYYIMEKREASLNFADFSESPPAYVSMPKTEVDVGVNKDGTYSGVELSKDLYGNYVIRFISMDSSGNIVSYGNYILNGSSQITNYTLNAIATYQFEVEGEYIYIETVVVIMKYVIEYMNSKNSFAFTGTTFYDVYRKL